jgi:hypothetical protein
MSGDLANEILMRLGLLCLKLSGIVLTPCKSSVLHLWRRCGRSLLQARAKSWPVTDATVDSRFEIDESSQRVRNLLVNLLRRPLSEAPTGDVAPQDPTGWTPGSWSKVNERTLPWLAGIRFRYRVEGITFCGTYLLPSAYAAYEPAAEDGKWWVGKRIKVRYNPGKPEQSVFLLEDGAPGKPRIPVGWDGEPYLVDLSLR